MSDLIPSVVTLNKGLNLSASQFTAEVGSLLSCNNYEITDSDGLKKIDGYEPYDGSASSSNTSLYILEVPDATSFTAGDILVATTNPFNGESLTQPVMVGYVVDTDATLDDVTLAVTNLDYLSIDSDISILDTVAGGLTSTTITSITEGSEYYTTEALYFQALTDSQTFLRGSSYKQSLGYPADGLHWFRDRLYAIAPLAEIRVRGRNGGGLTPAGTYTITITDGLHIGNSANSSIARVTGTRTETDINGFKSYFYTISPVTGDYDDWAEVATGGGGVAITGVSVVSGTATVVDAIGAVTTDNKSLAPSRAGGRSSFLWTCAPEQYYIDNGAYPMTFGWKPVKPNFRLKFLNGLSVTDPIKLERTFADVPATTTYYLSDGTNEYSFNIVSFFLDPDQGAWPSGNAAGYMQITNIAVVSGVIADVSAGWTIHSATPASGANQIADVDPGTWTSDGFDPKESLLFYNSRFEFISSNFYGDDTWDAFYGVNGANRAFYYTGSLFAFIYTQIDPTKDRPRHIENHHQHLALGFQYGSLQLSVVGEPSNFSGLDGASEHGMGDKITGLLSLNGTSLGVFCEQSIWSISGTNVDNFDTAVIAPKTGCLEYTLSNMGIPVFCNGSGIQTIEQSAKYGDFVGKPLSYDVNVWLRPRLRRTSNRYTNRIAVIGSTVVRDKNQYRLMFRDGRQLTMTINGDEGPKFTMQRILTELGGDLTPWAWSSQVGENGEEYLHFSYYNQRTGDSSDFVFENDKGWGFSGAPMDYSFEINWFFGDSPSKYFGVKKARLYGKTHGKASLKIQSTGALSQLESRYNTATELLDLPYTAEMYSEDLVDRSSKPANLSNRGLAIQLKVSNRQTDVAEPSHVCQVLVLATTTGGAFDV